jgi:hypothetical protein
MLCARVVTCSCSRGSSLAAIYLPRHHTLAAKEFGTWGDNPRSLLVAVSMFVWMTQRMGRGMVMVFQGR